MLPAVIALFFSQIPEQTSSASGLPATINPYPSLVPASSYSTPSYNQWRSAIIHAAGPSATLPTQTDRDCPYDAEHGDLVKRAIDPRELAAMLRDEYMPYPTPTAANGIIDGRDVVDPYAGYPPLTPSTYATTEKGRILRTTYLVPIPTHEVWTWKEKARRTPRTVSIYDSGLLSQMKSSTLSSMSTIIDERAPMTMTVNDKPRRSASLSHIPPFLQPLITHMPIITLSHEVYEPTVVTKVTQVTVTYKHASSSARTSSKTTVPHSTSSSTWTTVTAPPDTLLKHGDASGHSQSTTESQASRPARSSFTTSFSIGPDQLLTIVYEEEVVTRQTTGGGVTKTLTETLIHYPALPPVPPITWTMPGTTRSTPSSTSSMTVVIATTRSNEIAQASIPVVTSKTTKPATTTTITQASAVTTVSSSIVDSPASKNKPPFRLAITDARGLLAYVLTVMGLWLIKDIVQPWLAVVFMILAYVVQHAVFKPAVTQTNTR